MSRFFTICLLLIVAACTESVFAQTQTYSTDELRQHIKEADVIFVGTVRAIVPQKSDSDLYDPQWRFATVEVSEVFDGRLFAPMVLVKFSAQYDRYWMSSPKLNLGQEYVFILRWTLERSYFVASEQLDAHVIRHKYEIRDLITEIKKSK